jgi:Acetyltransferase (GNAT) domain
MVGETGLKLVSCQHRQGETGFVFSPDFQGRGLAAEAAAAMLALAFGRLGWYRVIGSCDARKPARCRPGRGLLPLLAFLAFLALLCHVYHPTSETM